MQLLFDKNTANERFLPVDTVNERVTENRLNASLNRVFDELDNVPDTSAFYSQQRFDTVDVVLDGQTIRLSGTYNTISVLTVTYSDRTKQYSLSVVLEYQPEPDAVSE
jgi:hypothetical protein